MQSRGITVRFVEKCRLHGAAGTSKGTDIEIRTSEQDITTQAATLAHEVAHSLLHWTADGQKITTREGKPIDKRQRELEAEATAYVLGNYFGRGSERDVLVTTVTVTSIKGSICSRMQGVFQSVGLIAGRTRWLAILAGCVAAITGAVSLSLLFPIVPSLLIFGAIAQPRFRRSGLWLMLVGALFLTVFVLPVGTFVLLDSFKTLRSHHDCNIVAVALGWASSFFLLFLCDAALMIEGHNLRLR